MSAVSDQELKDAAFGALELLKDTLRAQPTPFEMTEAQEDLVVIEALDRHGAHLEAHHIKQNRLDAFKLVCWMGGSLLDCYNHDEAVCPIIIDGIIGAQDQILWNESSGNLILPVPDRELLKSLLLAEKCGNTKHGIWMNGLYVAYHCCVASQRHKLTPMGFGTIAN